MELSFKMIEVQNKSKRKLIFSFYQNIKTRNLMTVEKNKMKRKAREIEKRL